MNISDVSRKQFESSNSNKDITIRKKNSEKVSLLFNGKTFKVFKNKLSLFHAGFAKYLENNSNKDLWKSLKKSEGKSEDCFLLFQDYILKGHITNQEVDVETIEHLYDLANAYHLDELKNDCREFCERASSPKFTQICSYSLDNKYEFLKEEIVKNDKKECIIELFSQKIASPELLANSVFSHFSTLKNEIEKFQNEHPKKLEMLKLFGWNALKTRYKEKMENREIDPDGLEISFSDLRDQINDLVKDLLNQAIKELKIGSVKVEILGTTGYNSDKDITLNSAEGFDLTTAEMVLVKALADLITVKITGTLPGIALDTEWYIHRNFLGGDVKSKEAKHQLVTLEIAMAIVQAKEGLKDSKHFQEYKEKQLECTQGVVWQIKHDLFEYVEEWYQRIELEIGRQLIFQKKCDGNNQENVWKEINLYTKEQIQETVLQMKKEKDFDRSYYQAKVLSQYSTLLRLGKCCGELESQIKLSKGQNVDDLIIQHDILYAIINCRQPEGTMSASELKTTLDSEDGQRATKNKNQQISFLNEKIKKENWFECGTKFKLKKNEVLLNGSKILKKVEEIKHLYPKVSLGGFVSAGRERLTQFIHVAKEGYNVVNAGKYFLRTMEANQKALRELTEKDLTDEQKIEVEYLIETTKPLYVMAFHFEQCKRLQVLNAVAFKKMLSTEIIMFKEHLDELALKGELDGLWSKFVMTPQEKIREMATFLLNKKYITEKELVYLLENEMNSKLDSSRMKQLDKIRDILWARAGFQPMQLHELHERAKTLTKEHYGLQEVKAVDVLIRTVEELTLKVEDYVNIMDPQTFPTLNNSFKIDFNNSWIGKDDK